MTSADDDLTGRPDDGPAPSYSGATRLRVAISEQAAELSDSTRAMVATYADAYRSPGDTVEEAARILADARELLALAVAYERRRGTSWETVGETLGVSRQAAHERYAGIERQLDDEMVLCWLAGDDPRYVGLPAGAAAPADRAASLDRWVIDRLQPGDPLYGKDPDDPERARPVSAGLQKMDTLEHSAMSIAAGVLLAKRRAAGLPIPPGAEPGHDRRKVELYERMLAEHPDPTGADAEQLRDVLAGVRARIAEREAAPADELAARRTTRTEGAR